MLLLLEIRYTCEDNHRCMPAAATRAAAAASGMAPLAYAHLLSRAACACSTVSHAYSILHFQSCCCVACTAGVYGSQAKDDYTADDVEQ